MSKRNAEEQFKALRSQLRLTQRKLKFAERVISDCARFDMHNRDITNVYWMERRRLEALAKRKPPARKGKAK